ncbi:MAG: hypothetical protein JWP91_2157 [Fibrobacteres bacterium]|nr:hypothetical protein [Fibrobacterota bacterium]
MNIGRNLFTHIFHRGGRRERPQTLPAQGNGNAPVNPADPPGRPRTDPSASSGATPPPSYRSGSGSANAFGTPGSPTSLDAQAGTPAPSFRARPRPDETRLDITDFGDRLGRGDTPNGSLRSGLGSLRAHYPRSELGRTVTPDGAVSDGSSMNAVHGGRPGTEGSSAVMSDFYREMDRLDAAALDPGIPDRPIPEGGRP